MSYFEVKVRKIEKVWIHPDADAMQMAKVEGLAYQFVVGLNVKPGDLVVYFPVDSVFTDEAKKLLPPVIAKKLGGVEQNRLVTVRLRGQLSQGLAIPVDELPYGGEDWKRDGVILTEELGITKYDPEPVEIPNARLVRLPMYCSAYDIQSCDVFVDVLELLLNQEVVVTEKVEGVNHAVNKGSYGSDVGFSICQRKYEVVPDEGKEDDNPYWKGAFEMGYDLKTATMATDLGRLVTVRSELVGPNPHFKNYYELERLNLYTFDIWLNGLPIDFDKQWELIGRYGLQTVPILHRGILRDILEEKSIQEFADGMSVINPKKRREGVVVRPVIEQTHPAIGRLILKQHSAKYLLKQG